VAKPRLTWKFTATARYCHALEQFIDNASKYSTPGTPISVTAEEYLGEIVLGYTTRARPSSRPIGSAFRPILSHRRIAASGAGNGLGLSIAKKAAEAHGGRAG